MKKSKGEYLIFLDSDDIFVKTMMKIYILKLKKIVICNSINFKTLNKYKSLKKRKNYLISNKKIKNKSLIFQVLI